MGVMDKILNVMRLEPEDEYEYDNENYEDDLIDEKPSRFSKRDREVEDDEFSLDSRRKAKDAKERTIKPTAKVTPMRPSKKQAGAGMEVCVIKPTGFEDSREITDTLLNNRTVVLNVEGLDVDVAQRIIDFSAGSCYAIDGNLQKISNYIFIITPASVDISGDFQSLVDNFDATSVQKDYDF